MLTTGMLPNETPLVSIMGGFNPRGVLPAFENRP